jgi:hypothetical protein
VGDFFVVGCPAFLKALGFLARIPWIAFLSIQRENNKIREFGYMSLNRLVMLKRRNLCRHIHSLTLERAPSGPLSSTVFLQFKHEHFVGSQRLPALKQSQYKAMHRDFGQLQPVGLS